MLRNPSTVVRLTLGRLAVLVSLAAVPMALALSAKGADVLTAEQVVVATAGASRAAEDWRIVATLDGHKSRLKSLRFSPDGTRLFSGSFDGEIKVWDLRTHKELATLNVEQNLLGLAMSPSGTTLASAVFVSGGRAEVKLWDTQTFELRTTHPCARIVYGLAFSRDGELMAAAGDHEVYVWSVRDGRLKHKFPVGMFGMLGLAFSPEGRTLYAGGMISREKTPGNPGILSAWEVTSGAKLGEVEFPYPVSGIDLSKDGTTIAVGAGVLHVLDIAIADGRINFTNRWSAIDERSQGGQLIMQEQFGCVAFSPDQRLVAGAAASPGPPTPEAGHVALFALRDGQRVSQLQTRRPAKDQVQPGDYNIYAVAFSPDGKLLASGGKEQTITLWAVGKTK